MEQRIDLTWKKLEKKLGYVFKDKELLRRALTRESAIQERNPLAATKSYQNLELVGDAAIKHMLSNQLVKLVGDSWSEGQLHSALEKMIGNREALPIIADKLGLSEFVVRGRGEINLTLQMKADMLEAVIGAISLDNEKQKGLGSVIQRLWEPYLSKTVKSEKIPAVVISAPVANNNNASSVVKDVEKKANSKNSTSVVTAALIEPLSPRTQRLFSGTSNNTSVEQFEEIVRAAPDLDRQNVGKKGNTALMTLLSKKKFRADKEFPRAQLLVKYGASWSVTNRKGETAEDLATSKGIDSDVIKRLKSTPVVKK